MLVLEAEETGKKNEPKVLPLVFFFFFFPVDLGDVNSIFANMLRKVA